jgi:hypothetical protein
LTIIKIGDEWRTYVVPSSVHEIVIESGDSGIVQATFFDSMGRQISDLDVEIGYTVVRGYDNVALYPPAKEGI